MDISSVLSPLKIDVLLFSLGFSLQIDLVYVDVCDTNKIEKIYSEVVQKRQIFVHPNISYYEMEML